jgi:hypothetical protein
MRRIRIIITLAAACLAVFLAAAPSALAQSRKLRVISSDSVPITYAYVTIEGGRGQITDERGEVAIDAGKSKTLTVNVRRIGFQPWFGKVEFSDTLPVLTISLVRVAQTLGAVYVSGRAAAPPGLQGFYDRWMMRQKGALSATFIGPEEIEFRHPTRITDMLSGLNGVFMVRTPLGGMVARGNGGTCFMTVLLDGQRLCPDNGCNTGTDQSTSVELGNHPTPPIDKITVDINKFIDPNDVSAIEVYARGGNMPISLQTADNGCGVIAFWTGSRRP